MTVKIAFPVVRELENVGIAMALLNGMLMVIWGLVQVPMVALPCILGGIELICILVLNGYMINPPKDVVKMPVVFVTAAYVLLAHSVAVAIVVILGVFTPSSIALLVLLGGTVAQIPTVIYAVRWMDSVTVVNEENAAMKTHD